MSHPAEPATPDEAFSTCQHCDLAIRRVPQVPPQGATWVHTDTDQIIGPEP